MKEKTQTIIETAAMIIGASALWGFFIAMSWAFR